MHPVNEPVHGGVKRSIKFEPSHRKRPQGAVAARRRARSRNVLLTCPGTQQRGYPVNTYKSIIALSLLTCLAMGCATVVEEATYTAISKDRHFELRDYPPHIVAETDVDGTLEDAGNKAFKRLFGYISGKNRSQGKIAMTAPVSQEPASGKIAMTAPVEQQRTPGGWAVSFMMPRSYTLDTLPLPEDPNVRLRQIPARRVASVRYSGTWREKRYRRYLRELKSWIAGNGFKTLGEPVWARYNPPFTPWFLRRNEILIPVDGEAKPKKMTRPAVKTPRPQPAHRPIRPNLER
jgi:effector-binding domain-containing protein